MRIARVIDNQARERLVCEESDGCYVGLVELSPGSYEKTDEIVKVARWLPPMEPRALLDQSPAIHCAVSVQSAHRG